MGKKSKKASRNKPKRSKLEIALSVLPLPIPLPVDAASPSRDNRHLADYCMDNLRLFDKHDERRFILFPLYLAIAFSDEDVYNKRDIKFLNKIANDESDLTYFRVESLHYVAWFYFRFRKNSPEGMTDCFNDILELCKNATELEKSHRLFPSGLVGEHLSERQHQAEELVDRNYSEKYPVFSRSAELTYMPPSAGSQCDNCKKIKAELKQRGCFRCCAKCKFEYYCSRECQLSAWENGHKQQCRKKGQYNVGDQAATISSHKTAMNTEGDLAAAIASLETTRHVQLVEYLNKEDSWVVVDLFGENKQTVPTEKLERLRPALWQCTETIELVVAQRGGKEELLEAIGREKKLIEIALEMQARKHLLEQKIQLHEMVEKVLLQELHKREDKTSLKDLKAKLLLCESDDRLVRSLKNDFSTASKMTLK